MGVDFSATYLSFALACVAINGFALRECTVEVEAFLMAMITLQNNYSSGCSNGVSPTSSTSGSILDNLGYIVALLYVASNPSSTFKMIDLHQLIGIAHRGTPSSSEYTSLLVDIDVESNEPLVLAASLCMSLLQVAEQDNQRIILLGFLHEIADISPSVLLLLEKRLIPLITSWQLVPNHTTTLALAEPLFTMMMAAPPEAKSLDISNYVTALGFSALLEFDAVLLAPTPDDVQYKLQCCAELLGTFLRLDEASK